ncbi:Aminotransferase, class V [Pelagophyceae sp. CCMP2097]|nr:Aminotransferase, class V [Pelagophyceae sp. CCMP2097]
MRGPCELLFRGPRSARGPRGPFLSGSRSYRSACRNGGLLEYSVVYTDRALNHMSSPFQQVMNDLHTSLTKAYNTQHAVLVPGSGTYAMELAARAFAKDGEIMVIRNGYFSYRWSQIFETMGKTDKVTVVHAAPPAGWSKGVEAVAPPPIEDVVAMIRAKKPSMVCAPHVETSAGIILPADYCRAIGEACKEVGAVFVLDGVASGTAWVDMTDCGVDAYVTAPQKGWSGPACVGVLMCSDRAVAMIDPKPSSFSIDLAKWKQVMAAYLGGAHMYHTTMPTDAVRVFRDVVQETEAFGLEKAHAEAWRLGNGVRDVLKARGFVSVAAPGFEAPGVVVVYAPDATYAAKFKAQSLQIAAGVPLMIGEPANFQTFRIGLFGLDKLANVDKTVANFEQALDKILAA